jgi:hypothetical protein
MRYSKKLKKSLEKYIETKYELADVRERKMRIIIGPNYQQDVYILRIVYRL